MRIRIKKGFYCQHVKNICCIKCDSNLSAQQDSCCMPLKVMMEKKGVVLMVLAVVKILVNSVQGHGRLLDPPSRSSLWRFPEFSHLDPPRNDEDNELNCGGFDVQHGANQGRCGLCGDAFNETVPRRNEDGGIFGRGIITRRFRAGQVIPVDIEITSPHGGYWELRLCSKQPVTQDCLDSTLLPFAGTTFTRYHVTDQSHEIMYYSAAVQLPPRLRCKQCVLQWHYQTGNRWGICEDGTSRKGCGPQETFRGCADVSIL